MNALHRIACNISFIPRVPRVTRPPARTLLRIPCRTLSATASAQPRKFKGMPCPQCKKPLPTSLPACPSCSYIEPVPPGITYYQALGLTHPDYNPYIVNLGTIIPVFRQTQKVCHPDRWAQQPPEKQQLAADQSSLLNKAFETLKDPLKRAEYLLTLRGHPINEEDTLHAQQQQELLMDVMEVRQKLEEAEGDERHDLVLQNEGTNTRTSGTERIEEAEADIENAIGNENWGEAKQATIRLRYWYSVAQAAKHEGSNH